MFEMAEEPPSTSQVEWNFEQLVGSGGLRLEPPSASKNAFRLAAVSVLQLGSGGVELHVRKGHVVDAGGVVTHGRLARRRARSKCHSCRCRRPRSRNSRRLACRWRRLTAARSCSPWDSGAGRDRHPRGPAARTKRWQSSGRKVLSKKLEMSLQSWVACAEVRAVTFVPAGTLVVNAPVAPPLPDPAPPPLPLPVPPPPCFPPCRQSRCCCRNQPAPRSPSRPRAPDL